MISAHLLLVGLSLLSTATAERRQELWTRIGTFLWLSLLQARCNSLRPGRAESRPVRYVGLFTYLKGFNCSTR